MGKVTRNRGSGLKSGRPPLSTTNTGQGSTSTVGKHNVNARRKSSKATRNLINKHHQLHKSRAAAVAAGDHKHVGEIDGQLQQLGGLEAYQAASLTGQDKDRGGDSSERLVEWLRKYNLVGPTRTKLGLRVLEVGALSSQNAISRMVGKGVEIVKRIDLNSQEPNVIEKADFMTFPISDACAVKYDIVSLSLVLNYVPDAAGRGEMLRRTTSFLRRQGTIDSTTAVDAPSPLPCLFAVMPLPCLTNSRYMTHNHFVSIMNSLGYEILERHESQKLSYTLFRWHSDKQETRKTFKKVEINPGRMRNNFAVVMNNA
ncbi:25S rRNA (adenine2142-N1)-methyltransferase [Exophiala xenobiotica]|uniref:25S rRNA adenine-N(1) methyltransferase n=1 Tax=Lithohypha guttulata TaxID=1690604 RepID=A0ABR0K8B5_9EURO|nr:25S rRNA (adenine2142-N1)-methyltransferase [Lithohypha guttulata]KAK5316902.1 25S rRNA (adenine2142-N1)-methyltransferase [Exophiala xenobiotica]